MAAQSDNRKPDWLKVKIPSGQNFQKIQQHRIHGQLATVCEEANCPNLGDCWKSGTATFMLMGDTCTRGCRFCAVDTAQNPPPLDRLEPSKLADVVKDLKLEYVVLTTVDRDDLPDQGSSHIKECVETIQNANPGIIVEILIPDFQGQADLIGNVAQSGAQVIGHNLECTRSLTPKVRDHRASYDQSLNVLRILKQAAPDKYTKSSIMLGFGETETEILECMQDIKDTAADFLTLGQYLQPNKRKLPVIEYVHPDQFKWYEERGLEMGFKYVASGPLVRSSYKAGENFVQILLKKQTTHS